MNGYLIHKQETIFRSTEEIFALFISMAFAVDAFRDVVSSKNFLYFSCYLGLF